MKKPNSMMGLLQLGFVLLLSISRAVSESSQFDESFLQCLLHHSDDSTAISQVIHTPDDSSYKSVLEFYIQNSRFLALDTPRPQLIITPVRESQIQTAIYCSGKDGLQMRIRSGGHDFEGSSYISKVPFFVLDMFNFRSVSVDQRSQTACVGAGATLGEIYYGIYQKSKTLSFPAGYWPTVAAGGHISGGGYGPLVRMYGLAADNVIDARIILANGTILDRVSMDEDLFWAIRGGIGSSFGVILSFKLKLVPVPEKVTTFKVKRNLEQGATKLVSKWQNIAHRLPVELSISLHVNIIRPNQAAKRNTVEITFISWYHGGVNELVKLMEERFPELGLAKEDCVQKDWLEYYPFFLDLPFDNIVDFLTSRVHPEKPYLKGKAELVQIPIPEDGLEKIWDLFSELEPGAAGMDWNPFGGMMDKIPESEIPFPHRAGNSFMVFKAVYWNEKSDKTLINKRLDWMKKLHNLMGEYVEDNPRRAYADYRDFDLGTNNIVGKTSIEQARKWGAPYFKNNFDRLVKVKTMVDPTNIFKDEQSFPPLTSLAHGRQGVRIM